MERGSPDPALHTRPYKEAWPVQDAIDEIRRLSGRQFDPQIGDVFSELDPYQLEQLGLTEPPAVGAPRELQPVA